jgi:hypothetical protein
MLIRFAFAQARKKKITARMYRQLEKQKYEARSLHIPKGQLQSYLDNRKLVAQELEEVRFKPNLANSQLA